MGIVKKFALLLGLVLITPSTQAGEKPCSTSDAFNEALEKAAEVEHAGDAPHRREKTDLEKPASVPDPESGQGPVKGASKGSSDDGLDLFGYDESGIDAKRRDFSDAVGDLRVIRRIKLDPASRRDAVDFLTEKAVSNLSGSEMTLERALEIGKGWARQFEHYRKKNGQLVAELATRKKQGQILRSEIKKLKDPNSPFDSKKGLEVEYPDLIKSRNAGEASKDSGKSSATDLIEPIPEIRIVRDNYLRLKGSRKNVLSDLETRLVDVEARIADLDRGDATSIGLIHQNRLEQVHAIRRLQDVADNLSEVQVNRVEAALRAVGGDVYRLDSLTDQIHAIALSVSDRISGDKSPHRPPVEYAERYVSAGQYELSHWTRRFIPAAVERSAIMLGKKTLSAVKWFNEKGPGKGLEPWQKFMVAFIFANSAFNDVITPAIKSAASGVWWAVSLPWHSEWKQEEQKKKQEAAYLTEEIRRFGEVKKMLSALPRMKTEKDAADVWPIFDKASEKFVRQLAEDRIVFAALDYFSESQRFPKVQEKLRTIITSKIDWGSPLADDTRVLKEAAELIWRELQPDVATSKNYHMFAEGPDSEYFLKVLAMRIVMEAKFQRIKEQGFTEEISKANEEAMNRSEEARKKAQEAQDLKVEVLAANPKEILDPLPQPTSQPVTSQPATGGVSTSQSASSRPAAQSNSNQPNPTYAEFMDEVVGRLFYRHRESFTENAACIIDSLVRALDAIPLECLKELSDTHPRLALDVYVSRTIVAEVLSVAKGQPLGSSLRSKPLKDPPTSPSK